MNTPQTQQPADPFAEFGGQSTGTPTVAQPATAQPATAQPTQSDPFAEFGGVAVKPPSGTQGDSTPSFLHGAAETTIKPIVQTAENVGGFAKTIYNEAGEHLKNGEYLKAAGTLLGALSGADERNPTIQMFHSLLDAHKEQLKTAAAAYKAGHYTEAAGHGLAGVTPLVGPAAAKAGEDIGQENTAEGLGEGAGLLATVLLPRAVPKIAKIAGRGVGATGEIASDVVKGEKAAQPVAEAGLRKVGNVSAPSLRNVLDAPIDTLESQAKAQYRQIDTAAGTDFKALNEKLANTEYQIRQLTETEEDLAREAQLEKSRQGIIDKIAEAKQTAIKNGVDPKILDDANANFRRANALKDVESKIFKNPSVVKGNIMHGTPETIDVNATVKALQKLQDSEKFGASRLEQAFGKEGAKAVLDDLYAAQRQGVEAMTRQQWAIRVAKIAGIGGAATLGHHFLTE